MSTINFNGKWNGYYELGLSYGDRLNGKKTEFSIILKEENGVFQGKCFDHVNDANNNAEIKGFFDGSMISFIKQYNDHIFITDEGKRIVDENSTHPGIEYTGYYNEEKKVFEGNWEMITHIDILDIKGEKRIGENVCPTPRRALSRADLRRERFY